MKVIFDHQVFSWQVYGGISRYFYELMNQFHENKSIVFDLPIRYSNNDYLKNSNFLQNKNIFNLRNATFETFLPGMKFTGKRKLFNFLQKAHLLKTVDIYSENQSLTIDRLASRNYDIFHPTYYDPYFLEYIGTRPFVLTIYDMIHELKPEMFSDDEKITEWKRILANKADAIIAISENTKNDIMKIYGIHSNKIKVIHLGMSLKPISKILKLDFEIPKKYILYIGDRWTYKNFKFFIESVPPILKNDKDLFIVCGGGRSFDKEEIKLFQRLDCTGRILHYSINDDLLSYLYKNALAFVFPSLYEGFGIPVLEAFSCGCPVVLSDTSSFPEIACDAAEYFDPIKKESLQKAINKVIYNNDLRMELIKKGFERVKNFTWHKTASETAELYESLL